MHPNMLRKFCGLNSLIISHIKREHLTSVEFCLSGVGCKYSSTDALSAAALIWILSDSRASSLKILSFTSLEHLWSILKQNRHQLKCTMLTVFTLEEDLHNGLKH